MDLPIIMIAMIKCFSIMLASIETKMEKGYKKAG